MEDSGQERRKQRRTVHIAGLVWSYLGTLAAFGLLVGVLGMGLYYLAVGDRHDGPMCRCFTGLYNSAGAEEPRGLGEMDVAVAGLAGAHLRFEYDGNGRPVRLVHINRDGLISAMPGSRVAEQRIDYDAAGHIIRKSNFAPDGSPAPDASGVAIRSFSYDEKGRLRETRFFDANGANIVPRMPGFACERICYDDKDRPLSIEYLDGSGNPTVNAAGESCVAFAYDDEHGRTIRTNSVDGYLKENRQGIATEERQKTQDGSSVRISWFDADGRPAVNPQVGAVAVQRDVLASGMLGRERLCGTDGIMRREARVFAEHLVRSDADGNPEWECYNAADGMPCLNTAAGYAERVCEYNADGSPDREYFWDADGNPTFCYEQRHRYDDGHQHLLKLNTDGSTELRRIR